MPYSTLKPMYSRFWRALVAALYRGVGWPRARLIASKIAPHLAGETLLDLGAGTGHTAVILSRQYGQRLLMLDVAPHGGAWGQKLVGQPIGAHLSEKFGLKRVRYDGRTIPFDNDSFDTVLVAFVLHHCEHPDAVLGEAARVVKKRVLVLEDGDNAPPTRAARLWDALFNLEFFHPHQERTLADWRQLFAEHHLHVATETRWQWRLGPLRVQQNLFVLEKQEKTSVISPNPHGTPLTGRSSQMLTGHANDTFSF